MLMFSLSFVWLLAGSNQVLDCVSGFDALFLLKLADPVRNVRDHVASRLAARVTRSFDAARSSLTALGALHYFYFFLRHKFFQGSRLICEFN